MSKHRQAARIDANQPAIVKALRKIAGVTVYLDVDDILVGYKGVSYWYEIKASVKSSLQPVQTKLLAEWKGHYKIVSSLDMILEDIGID